MGTFSSTRIASEYCQVKIGGDAALIKGLAKLVLAAHEQAIAAGKPAVFDLDFIAEHTLGLEALIEDLNATSWEDILEVSGVEMAQIERMANIYIQAKSAIICYGMGITQHLRGTETVMQIANLLMMRGNFGRPGAGICPVRGHSNVQGDRTVGITEKPTAEFLANLEAKYGFQPPVKHGHSTVDSLKAMVDGTSKVFIGLGGNFAAAVPDTAVVREAMGRLKLTAGVATKLNRGLLIHGEDSLILPCLARTDIDMQATGRQAITVEDSMSMVHASAGLVQPPSPDLMSEIAIVCGMAKATLPESGIDWDALAGDYSLIRDHIEAVFPQLFANYNERIRVPGGFHLFNGPRERVWKTKTGKANFMVMKGLLHDDKVEHPDKLMLATIRSHGQYNTTIYNLDDRYRGVFGGRMVVFMNVEDMAARNIKPDQLIELECLVADGQRRVVGGFKAHPYNIPRGSVASYYPETNDLMPLAYHDAQSKTPVAKSIPVLVRAMAESSAMVAAE
jgi:formate dehydrogenase major subunit